MLGFLLSLLIPIKIAAAAVLIYLFLKLAVAAETPNSQTTNLNQQVSWSCSDAPGAPGIKVQACQVLESYPQEKERLG